MNVASSLTSASNLIICHDFFLDLSFHKILEITHSVEDRNCGIIWAVKIMLLLQNVQNLFERCTEYMYMNYYFCVQ